MALDRNQKTDSPRKRLRRFVDTGELRYSLERAKVEDDVVDLAVLVIDRYCAPRPRRKNRADGTRP